MFLERLSTYGMDDSKYYVPNGEFNTLSADDPISMPNCTDYAYLRGNEVMDLEHPENWVRVQGGFGNAKTWFQTSPMPKGYELKTGSVAVFDGDFGHVCIVERKIDDTHALVSQSFYNADKSLRDQYYWNKRVIELKVGEATIGGVGALIGFIYLPIDDIRTVRNSYEQIEIKEEMVNVRTDDLEIYRKGCYAPMGIYDVLDKKIVDGYTWYKLDTDNWVREGSWIAHYPAESDEMEELRKENAELKERLKQINSLSEV